MLRPTDAELPNCLELRAAAEADSSDNSEEESDEEDEGEMDSDDKKGARKRKRRNPKAAASSAAAEDTPKKRTPRTPAAERKAKEPMTPEDRKAEAIAAREKQLKRQLNAAVKSKCTTCMCCLHFKF